MRATVFHGPFDVRVEQVPDAALREPTDALVRTTHAAICGSDLWPYRGLDPFLPGGNRAMNGWALWKRWDLRFRPSSGETG